MVYNQQNLKKTILFGGTVMKKQLRLKIQVLLAGVFALVLIITLVGILLRSSHGFAVQINGVDVEEDEYLMAMNANLYETTQYFSQKYKATVDKAFWETDFNGEVPYKALADRSIEELKRIRAVYSLAQEKGYIDSASYKDLLFRFTSENKSREERIKNGEPVYGLSQFTLDLFIEYEMDSIQKLYCNDLENEGMKISEEERIKYYEENKDKMFTKYDDVELEYLKVNYSLDEMPKEDIDFLRGLMEEVYKKLDESTCLGEVVKSYTELMPYYSHQKILSDEMSAQSRIIGDVLYLSENLKKNESTNVVDENGALYLIRCMDRNEYGYMELDEVADIINKNIREERYDYIIEERAASSVVSGNMERLYKFTLKNIKR